MYNANLSLRSCGEIEDLVGPGLSTSKEAGQLLVEQKEPH